MTYPLPPAAPPPRASRSRRAVSAPGEENGKYTPLWMMLVAILLLLAGVGRLLARPVGQWAAAWQPTPTPTLTAMPTSEPAPQPTPTLTPTPFPTQEAVAFQRSEPENSLVAVEMVDELRGWGQGVHSVWRTEDGGLRWRDVTPPELRPGGGAPPDALLSFFLDHTTAWLLAAGAGPERLSQLYRTDDGGQSWSAHPAPFGWAELFFLSPADGWALVNSPEAGRVEIYQTADGGGSWRLMHRAVRGNRVEADSLPVLDGLFLSGPVFRNALHGWISGRKLDETYFYRTTDGGQSWKPVDLSLPEQDLGRRMFLLLPRFFGSDALDGILPAYLSSPDGPGRSWQMVFFFTGDGGETWRPSQPVEIASGRMVFQILSPREIVVLDGDRLYQTVDAAASWQWFDTNLRNARQTPEREVAISQVEFVSRRSGWAWGWDFGNRFHLYRTQDGGQRWQAVRIETVERGALGCEEEAIPLGRAVERNQQSGPYEGWSVYQPGGYGFSFNYPPDWRVLEVYEYCSNRPARLRSVMALPPRAQGGYLVVSFRQADEPANLLFPLPRVGEMSAQGSVQFFAQPLSRGEVRVNGEVRAVYYAQGEEIYVEQPGDADLYFTLTLLGRGEPGREEPLAAEVLALADQVIASFHGGVLSPGLLATMDLNGFISISPDGAWHAETLFANTTFDGLPLARVFQRVTLYSGTDRERPWIILDRWLPREWVRTLPGGYQWSPDGRDLYFTEAGYAEPCAPFPYQAHLWRAHITARQLIEIETLPPERLPALALSPDARWLAYLAQNGADSAMKIWIRDLANGAEQAISYIYPAEENGWLSGDLLWSPDSTRLVFSVSRLGCEPAGRMGQVLLVDPQAGAAQYLTSLEKGDNFRIYRWDENDSVVIEDPLGVRIRLDLNSGARTAYPPVR